MFTRLWYSGEPCTVLVAVGDVNPLFGEGTSPLTGGGGGGAKLEGGPMGC